MVCDAQPPLPRSPGARRAPEQETMLSGRIGQTSQHPNNVDHKSLIKHYTDQKTSISNFHKFEIKHQAPNETARVSKIGKCAAKIKRFNPPLCSSICQLDHDEYFLSARTDHHCRDTSNTTNDPPGIQLACSTLLLIPISSTE